MPIDKDDTDALRKAVKLLEHPSLAARLTNMVGKPVGLMGRALPATLSSRSSLDYHLSAAEDGSAPNRCMNDSAKVVLGRVLINRDR
jgi:hypothetical protein